MRGHKLKSVLERETATFLARTQRSAALLDKGRQVMPDGVPMPWMAGLYHHPSIYVTGGSGAVFEDVDGNRYLDFNLADLSNTVGYGPNAISRRLAAQAERGLQFLLPTEDAIAVSGELAGRTGLPMWQYTLSASSANTEVIRIARAFTRRAKVVLFEGKYHGHIETTMAKGGVPRSNKPAEPEAMGISPRATADTVHVPFNDLESLARALADGDVALVLAEPALTNCQLVLPDAGFLDEACRLTRKAGALFALDETHTWQMAYGGFIGTERLAADFVTLGKGLGSGAPLGAYGMHHELGAYLQRHRDGDFQAVRGIALGGTTFASAMTLAAARAMLEEVSTEAGNTRTAALRAHLADGIDDIIEGYGLPWRAFRYGPRSGFCLTPELPRNYQQAQPSLDPTFSSARRIYMANRGVWEAIASAGPQVSFAHSGDDVERYLQVASDFMAEVVA